MIKVSESITDGCLRLEVKGHSGYAEIGKDIVCSAVSILTYTVAQLILEMNSYGKLAKPPTVRLCEGDSVIEAECKNSEAIQEVKNIMYFAEAGYSLLQNSYPEYVKFIINSI